MKTAVKFSESADYRRGPGIFLTETPSNDAPKHLLRPPFPRNPHFPPSGPARRLFQGPPAESKVLAALITVSIALAVWLWLASPTLAQPTEDSSASDKLSQCFSFPKEWKVSEEGIKKATEYLRTLSANPSISSATEVVCPRDASQFVTGLPVTVKALRIDGEDGDWKGIPRAVEDKQGNVQVHTKGKPNGEIPKGMDLAEVSYVYTERDLFLRFKTHGSPAKGEVSYWFQIYVANGDPLYSIVVSEKGRWLHFYDKGKIARTVNLTGETCEVAIKDIVEARITCSEMPGLPEMFDVVSASYSGKNNWVNYPPRFSARSALITAGTTPTYLLSRYAEKVDLESAGLIPLAVSISESFAYDHVDPSVRETVVADGVAMIGAGNRLAKELKDLSLESLIAWSNRSLTWGGLLGPYLDQRGRITREAYEFMFLNPEILGEVRTHLHSLGVGRQGPTREIAEAINKWATSKNRYRWKLEVLKEWSQARGGNWTSTYKDAAKDVQEGRDQICRINGTQIYYYNVMSPNVNWLLYKKNKFYYGACGDVAVMEMLALKAIGIPDSCFFWRFGKEDALIHTFAGYYDRDTNTWRSPQQPSANMTTKGASVLQWSLPPLTAKMPNFTVTPVGGDANLWVSERSPYLQLSVGEMRQKLTEGFSHKQFCQILYAQVGRSSGDYKR